MSSGSIDDKIVSISFNNAEFEKQIISTLGLLDKLDLKINGISHLNALSDLNASIADTTNIEKMGSAVQHIASKFTALGAVGFSAIQDLTQNAISFVTRFAKNDILGPIITGGTSRANKIEQAKFQFAGLGMDVEASMASALKAVKGTAYGLDEAAGAAAVFGASGIGAGDQMTAALRGVAGTAAITGRSFGEMSQIFTQSAATGKITNMDLQQFATRNLNAASAYAKQLGITEAQVHEMASQGKISFKDFAAAMDVAFGSHATEASKTYTGSLNLLHTAMARLGATFITPEQEQKRNLFNALSPAVDSLNDGIQPLFKSILAIKAVIGGDFINKLAGISLGTNSLFNASMVNFGRALEQVFVSLATVFLIVKDAFKDIFPSSMIERIAKLSEYVLAFSNHLKMGGDTIQKVKDIFRGFFAVVSIGIEIIKGIAMVVGDLLHALFPAGAAFLSLGSSTGNFLTSLQKVLVAGGGIHDFFVKFEEDVKRPISFIASLIDKIKEFFGQTFKSSNVTDSINSVGSSINVISRIWNGFVKTISTIDSFLGKILAPIADFFKNLGSNIANSISLADLNLPLNIISVGLLGGLVHMFKKFVEGGALNIIAPSITNALDQLTSTLEQFQVKLKAEALMKLAEAVAVIALSMLVLATIKPDDLIKAIAAVSISFSLLLRAMNTLDEITSDPKQAARLVLLATGMSALAVSVGILALALKLMSSMSWSELAKGLFGVSAGLAILIIAAKSIEESKGGMYEAAFAIGIMSVSLLLLNHTVKEFGEMKWDEMNKGLAGLAAALLIFVVSTQQIKDEEKDLLKIGFALSSFAIGIAILAFAITILGKMDTTTMLKGLAGIGIGLVLIVTALKNLPEDVPARAKGLLFVGLALNVVAKAIRTFGQMDLKTLAQGLISVAIVLEILVVAMNEMQAAPQGAMDILLISGALVILAYALKQLGELSIAQIATALITIALTFAIVGGAAYLLSESIPFIFLLGVALEQVAIGFALFGVAAFLVAEAMNIIAVSGVAAALAIVKMLNILGEAIPQLAATGALLVVNFVKDLLAGLPEIITQSAQLINLILDEVIKIAPKIGKALVAIIGTFLDTVNTLLPKISKTVTNIIDSLIQIIVDNTYKFTTAGIDIFESFSKAIGSKENVKKITESVGRIIDALVTILLSNENTMINAGVTLILGLLAGIASNIDRIISAVTGIIISILDVLAQSAVMFISAGFNILISMLMGIASGIVNVIIVVTSIIDTIISTLGQAAIRFAQAGTDALVSFLGALTGDVVKIGTAVTTFITTLITEFGKNSQKIIDTATSTAATFLDHLGDDAKKIASAATDFLGKLLDALSVAVPTMTDKIVKFAIALFDGFTTVINQNSGQLGTSWGKFAAALVKGMGNAFVHAITEIIRDVLPGPLKSFVGAVNKVFGINSPSTVFYYLGTMLMKGLSNGVTENVPTKQITSSMNTAANAVTSIVSKIADTMGQTMEFNPTITPVLDLSKVKAASGDIAKYMQVSDINPASSLNQASVISNTNTLTPSTAAASSANNNSGTTLTFAQTINAPTALSTNDIYRNTKSQIVMAKEALGIV